MRVLIVDDDEDTVVLLSMLLERQGWQVDTKSTVAEATTALRAGGYDALVADLHLSDGSGMTLPAQAGAGALRAAILVTGSEEDDERSACLEHGFSRYLTKPVNGSEIITILRSVADASAAKP